MHLDHRLETMEKRGDLMLEFIKDELNTTITENGAVTYATSGSDCLDLFATVGALRHANEEEIVARFLLQSLIFMCIFINLFFC